LDPFRYNYGFRFRETPSFEIAHLKGIGWENVINEQYNHVGLSRGDKPICLFQYTLSGKGTIRIRDQMYSLTPGMAFIVWIPSDHHYYFSDANEHWEFLYISMCGEKLYPTYEEIVSKIGNVVSFPADSGVIRTVKSIFEKAKQREISDGFLASSYAYRFIMELYRSAVHPDTQSEIPEYINNAVNYIELHYGTIGNLDEMADISGVSKHHFLRQFKKYIGFTPLEYLNKLRIENAVELLRTTEMTLDSVAQSVGFANGNYFSKVFRQWVGIAPGKFRQEDSLNAADNLYIK
jgi:AraC-like DNA-binding protein